MPAPRVEEDMARHLDTVVALQQALDQLQHLEETLAGVPPEMRELHDEYTTRKAEIEQLEAVIAEAETDRRSAEAEVQDCEVKLKQYQEQVNRVRTQREYSAILQELDLVKEKSRAFEDTALVAMDTQEQAEERLVELRQAFETLDGQYRTEAEKWEAAKPAVAQQAESTAAHVAELREALPSSSLLTFQRLRDRTEGNPLAEVLPLERQVRGPSMWHCGACNYNVRPQSVVEILNHGSLIHCDSCKRILFIAEQQA